MKSAPTDILLGEYRSILAQGITFNTGRSPAQLVGIIKSPFLPDPSHTFWLSVSCCSPAVKLSLHFLVSTFDIAGDVLGNIIP